MATIICRRLTFGYDGSEENIFTDLDLTIDTGWRSALVGRNGRGKTTLLRLIHGDLVADRGNIEGAPATYLFPKPQADPQLSAVVAIKDSLGPYREWEREMDALVARGDEPAMARYGALLEAFQDAGGYEIDANIERELDALGLDTAIRTRPIGSLSGGEQTRALLAGLFAAPSGFPLIDEPTNHLDREGRATLADYLRSKPGFLLVSHDRAFLDGSCDHVIALNADTVDVERTSFSAWRERFRQERDRLAARNVDLKRQIAGFEETARARRAGALKREGDKAPHTDKGFIGHRAAKQMKRAIASERRAEKAADERRETLTNLEKSRTLKLRSGDKPPRQLVVASDLGLSRGGRPLFDHVSFEVGPGDRLAIVGPNGCGKSTLLQQIAGENFEMRGALVVPGHISMARAHQHPTWTDGDLRQKLADDDIDESRFRQIMAVMGVRGPVLDQPLEAMSHGQQKKIDLARTFMADADLLLWDEPLNFIDIDAREQIEDVILRDRPTLVFIEHDAAFVARVATEVIDLSPSR